MTGVEIVEPRDWAAEFPAVHAELVEVFGDLARRVDHIGSTSIPDLPAKDVLDIQVTVADDASLGAALDALRQAGWPVRGVLQDHAPAGHEAAADPSQWVKGFTRERPGLRRTHVHLRVAGRANWRYPLLFRDYLRAHPAEAAAYGQFKRRAAPLVRGDVDAYAELKDPVCDLIYLAAGRWAESVGWRP